MCERSKSHLAAQGEFCHNLARQWKNRSGSKKTGNMDYWKNASVIQSQLNRIDDNIFENIGREHEGMWGKLNGECQLALVSRCEIPYVCERTLLDPTPRSQYLLTHQVLQRVLIETVDCPDSLTVSSFVTEDSTYTELCAKMYMEASYLDVLNLPIVHRDLFTEFGKHSTWKKILAFCKANIWFKFVDIYLCIFSFFLQILKLASAAT